jgi:2-phospho-L-lactate guanylyltransferase
MSKVLAIVPVKPLTSAKGRLSARLSPAQRRRLVLTMLQDVLAALAPVPLITQTLVVTADAGVAAQATHHGAGLVAEPEARGLNEGVAHGIREAMRAGATRVLVLPADLPFATSDDITRLVAASADTQRPSLTMVPAADGDGTNALLISPPTAITPSFGPGSFLAHLAQALARRIDVRVLHLSSLALDIDRPPDLARLASLPRYEFLIPHGPTHAPGGAGS